MLTDQIVNLIYFAVGLAIGLLQLYIGQRQFESQQREKMDELRNSLTEIQEKLAVLQELSSQRTFDVQDKLIRLAAREEAVTEVTMETTEKIRELIEGELQKAGVADAVGRTKILEAKVSEALEKSASTVVDIAIDDPVQLSLREAEVLKLVLEGHTVTRIAARLKISVNVAGALLSRIYRKAGVSSRGELIDKFNRPDGGHGAG